jgi:nitronate monooxygenase
LIAAPMTGVSGLELVDAAARGGIGASFPVHNADSLVELERRLTLLDGDAAACGAVLPNLIVHRSNTRLSDQLAVVARHRVPAVITSVGSPAPVVEPLHDAGIGVFSDVASMRHVERAIVAGVDGLVLLTAGAGGQTGWANPFAFVRAVRARWGGTLVLAGGVADGAALLAALIAGFDLAYMGTPFIATSQSTASPDHKRAVVAASIDDIELDDAYTGLPTSLIRTAKDLQATVGQARSFDVAVLEESRERELTRYSAGHSAGCVDAIVDVETLVARVESEFRAAASRLRSWNVTSA